MIYVICPTRERPEKFQLLLDSVLNTSTKATLIAYVDEDWYDKYPPSSDRYIRSGGKRTTPVEAMNLLARKFRSARIYGMVPDDAQFVTPGWDEYMIRSFDGFKNDIGVVSPHHNYGNYIDMPFVSRNWIDTLGWFAWPQMKHYCWTFSTGIFGEATEIVWPSESECHIEHTHDGTARMQLYSEDAVGFFNGFALGYRDCIVKLQEARNA